MRNTDLVELTDDQIDVVAGGADNSFNQTGNVVAVGVNDINANVVALVQALNSGAGSITDPVFNNA
jgi:hypothetical protein